MTTSKSKSEDAAKLLLKAKELREQADELEARVIRDQGPALCKEAAERILTRKGKVAVFLGAGASKTFDWPLTQDLLPIILRGLVAGDLFEDVRINSKQQNEDDRKLLKKALIALCPGLNLTRSSVVDKNQPLPLVTSLLSMLDFSLSSGQALIAGLSADEIKSARTLLERAIYEAIEHQETATSKNYWPPREPNQFTFELVKWLDKLRDERSKVAVITSNYDVAIEKAWGFEKDNVPAVQALALDFGFDWLWPSNNSPAQVIARPTQPQRRLYKLHGSTNWLRCGLCDRVYINPEVGIAVFAYDRNATPNNACHCGHAKLDVQIVSPSFVREVRAPNLISVWQRALNWLREADDWIIVGYSFPDEDLNIRSLFTRALASGESIPYVTAIQRGVNEQTRMRYEAFFPSGRLEYLSAGLDGFLTAIR